MRSDSVPGTRHPRSRRRRDRGGQQSATGGDDPHQRGPRARIVRPAAATSRPPAAPTHRARESRSANEVPRSASIDSICLCGLAASALAPRRRHRRPRTPVAPSEATSSTATERAPRSRRFGGGIERRALRGAMLGLRACADASTKRGLFGREPGRADSFSTPARPPAGRRGTGRSPASRLPTTARPRR